MSIKLDLSSLISNHYSTLRNDNTGKISKIDLFTFALVPIIICIVNVYYKLEINAELRGALINFGAIFSALLMSVLVLVYDQDNKLTEKKLFNEELSQNESSPKKDIVNYEDKKELLNQLYHNICYAIIVSLSIVVFPMLQIMFNSFNWDLVNRFFINPLIVFSLYSMVTTTLMIVKRMHALLNTNLTND